MYHQMDSCKTFRCLAIHLAEVGFEKLMICCCNKSFPIMRMIPGGFLIEWVDMVLPGTMNRGIFVPN